MHDVPPADAHPLHRGTDPDQDQPANSRPDMTIIIIPLLTLLAFELNEIRKDINHQLNNEHHETE